MVVGMPSTDETDPERPATLVGESVLFQPVPGEVKAERESVIVFVTTVVVVRVLVTVLVVTGSAELKLVETYGGG